MKKLLFRITLFMGLFFPTERLAAQIIIGVDSVFGIPEPVQEDSAYNLTFYVSRHDSDTTTFSGNLYILIKSQSTQVIDTMGFFTPITLFTNGDTIITDTFTFRASSFDGGDNIVVVWPSSSQFLIPDSLYFNVYFSGIGVPENSKNTVVAMYPNPATDILSLYYSDPEKFERVRILDAIGKEMVSFSEAVNEIDVKSFRSGMYFIEVRDKIGLLFIRKIIIE